MSKSFNKRITGNMLKEKGHYLRSNRNGYSAMLNTQGLRVQVPNFIL